MARYADDAPYEVSRAALRRKHGARVIDASAPQSSRDTTPSGRQAYLQQQGATELEAGQQVKNEFKANFPFRLEAQPRMVNRGMIQNPNPQPVAPGVAPQFMQSGLASPQDIGRYRATGASYGSFQTPYGPVSFGKPPSLGLLPETGAPEDLAPFMPSAVTPLSGFSLPKFRSTLNKPVSSIYG